MNGPGPRAKKYRALIVRALRLCSCHYMLIRHSWVAHARFRTLDACQRMKFAAVAQAPAREASVFVPLRFGVCASRMPPASPRP